MVKGKKAQVWIGDIPVEGEHDISIEIEPPDLDDATIDNFREEYLAAAKGVEFSGTYLAVDDEPVVRNAWFESFITPMQIEVYPSGDRWFMPWVETEGYAQHADMATGEFRFSLYSDRWNRHWRNRWAPIVYWLWGHVWCPLRQLVGKTLRFLSLKRPPQNVE